MTFTTVHETENGKKTGITVGYSNLQEAVDAIDRKRWLRDNSPVWAAYKVAKRDWTL